MKDEKDGSDASVEGLNSSVEARGYKPDSHAQSSVLHPPPVGSHPSSLAVWLDRAIAFALVLMAASAPVSIAATQGAWLLASSLWLARFAFKPRPALRRTPLDVYLLGFIALTFLSALFSYNPDVSFGKMRAVSLFTIVYVVSQNVFTRRMLRVLVVALVASCSASAIYAFGEYAAGRGVKFDELSADSPLRAAGVEAGDTVVGVDGHAIEKPEDIARRINERGAGALRWPDGNVSCSWDERSACLDARRGETLTVYSVSRAALLEGVTAEERLGVSSWSKGRDERANGLLGHYTTYAEILQLVASLALGLLVALRRKRSMQGALVAVAFALMTAALVLTVTRASWLGLLLSAFTIAAACASRRALLITLGVALPLVVAGLLVLQQKRRVGFLDPKEGSTSWRLVVWREGFEKLTESPRHMLVGVGMDSLKRRWREWGMFDRGRLPWGHLHSTPLQIAFERGVPALLVWLALLVAYARMLLRLARRGDERDWFERGLALGALGGAVGFFTSGLVHYNMGDSEVVMVFYFVLGLALALERNARAEGERRRVAVAAV